MIISNGKLAVKADAFLRRCGRHRQQAQVAVPWIERDPGRSAAYLDRWQSCGYYVRLWGDAMLDRMTVINAEFCGLRMCPGCEWRRSLRNAACIGAIADRLQADKRVMLMVTLTVRNVGADELRSAILRLNRAYNTLMRRKRYSVWGDNIRKLEVTYNYGRDDYHPHLHALAFVRPGYFKGQSYISHDALLQDWRDVYGDQRITQVDIRRCRDSKTGSNAILEVSKYAAKTGDYLGNGEDVYNTYAAALRGIRLAGYSGECKRLRKAWEDGELSVDDEPIEYIWQLLYEWYDGQGYVLHDMTELTPDAAPVVTAIPKATGSGGAPAAQSSRRG